MHPRTRHRSRLYWTWIACLAILFNAFAPVLSHAMGMQAAAGASVMMEMEVCTALGMEMRSVVSSDSSDPADAGKLQKNMGHCACCVAHVPTHGQPPPMPAVFAPAPGRDAWPPLYYQSSRSLFPWALAQPRAPPALS
jgi:hypothetical protein